MANKSRSIREADLLPHSPNGNDRRQLGSVSARELYEATAHGIGAATDRLRDVLGNGFDWYKNATLSQRLKVLGAGTIMAVGGVVGTQALEQDTMTQGQQIVYLAQHGSDGQANPTEQFGIISDALEGYIQPKARELFELSQTDTPEGSQAKETLTEGIDGLIAAGQFYSTEVDLENDQNDLAQSWVDLGAAQKAGLLPDNFMEIPTETRYSITAELGEKLDSIISDLIRTQQTSRKIPPTTLDR